MTICNSRLGLWVWRDIICIWTTMKTRTPDLLSMMSYACANMAHCPSSMPMTSDNTHLSTQTVCICIFMNTFTNYLCLYCVYLPLGSSQTQRWKPFHVHLVQLSKGFIELKPICGFIPAKQARPIKSKLQEFVFASLLHLSSTSWYLVTETNASAPYLLYQCWSRCFPPWISKYCINILEIMYLLR